MVTSIGQLDLNKVYSYADYISWQISERIELLKGKILEMAAPSRKHQDISVHLTTRIYNFLSLQPCRIYTAPFDVRLPTPLHRKKSDNDIITVVQPDICVICDKSKLDDRGCLGAPDLVVEILSPGNSEKEMKLKYDLYQESGVKEYWIVFPEEKTVIVYALNEKGKFIGLQPFTSILKTDLFAGLEIDLDGVFQD